jgi:hypothetical protein
MPSEWNPPAAIDFQKCFPSEGKVRMKYFSFGRLAGGGLLILLGTFPLLKAATNGYHLLKKYTFGAAEGSTREYFDYITVDSAARRVSTGVTRSFRPTMMLMGTSTAESPLSCTLHPLQEPWRELP